MANSKSNIYPVQLQGAELNLNKLDAEIKQYSGFNKNNAPFVGGCLSNIFTKDETIEGATSQNTYIAPNGDVYRVTTEGLFKNGEKVLYATQANFVEVNRITDDTDIVKYFGEHIFLKRSFAIINGYRSYKWDLYVNDVIYTVATTRELDSLYIDYIEKHCFTGVMYSERIFYFAVLKGNNVSIFKIDLTNYSVRTGSISLVINDLFDSLITINYGSSSNYLLIYVRYKNNNVFYKKNFIIDKDTLNLIATDKNFKIGNYIFPSRSFKFCNNYGFLDYTYLPEYTDPVHIFTSVFFSNYDSENDVILLSRNAGYEGDFDCSSGSLGISKINSEMNSKIDLPNFYLETVNYKGKLITDSDNNRGFTFLCCSFLSGSYASSGFNYKYDDELNCYVGDYPLGLSVRYGDSNSKFYLLFNNNNLSGISVNGILIEEWNEDIDVSTIFYDKAKHLYYKKGSSFYKISLNAQPRLRCISDQIVINSCEIKFNYKNSFHLSKNKPLIFAPDYNNSLAIKNNHPGDIHTYDLDDVTNNVIIASAVNEYRMDENSSLLLNPVSFYDNTDNQLSILSIPSQGYVVNIYLSYNNPDPIYIKSLFYNATRSALTSHIDDKLIGLPFPTNTDGNVQYSPSLFATEKGNYGNLVFISEGGTAYKLMTYDNKAVMSYFLSTAVEGLQDFFTIQGQLYGILDNQIYSFSIVNEVANRGDFIVSVEGLQFVGNTPYEALFFSKTNRCLYSFSGANVLTAKQFVDKISEVRNYKYNPATQSIFLITDIGVIVYSLFGIYQIEFLNCQDMYLLNNGVILTDNEGTFKYVKYYKEETTDDYTKENINLETCFYGMNNQTVTINDCLYMRLFSEEHEEGNLEVSATTLSLSGRMTEKTTFKIKERDWDKITHTIYLRYQPKEQRGLGISFSINSPFKIASLSVGSQADAILVDKVSKGAINAPQRTSNNTEW